MAVIFPSTGLQVMCAMLYILGLSLLAHCLSRRFATENAGSWSSLKQITWPRLCILLLFVDSWLFLAASDVLVFGIGLETSREFCVSGIFLCVLFYATSKFLSYLFLIEKVHVVWMPGNGVRRFRSTIYIISFVTVCLYGVVVCLMLVGKVHFLRATDNVCIIGLKSFSSIPLLAYDAYINVFLTVLFLWPILRSSVSNGKVKAVARRTLIASLVSLTTSTVNMGILTHAQGHQRGWVCLSFCGLDVVVNAVALFWVTSGSTASSNARSLESSGQTKPTGAVIMMGPMSPPPTPGANKPNFNEQDFDYLRQTEGVGPKKFTLMPVTARAMDRNSLLKSPLSNASPRVTTFSDIETAPIRERAASPNKGPSVLKSMAELFRTTSQERDPELQVTVQYEVEEMVDDGTAHGDDDSRHKQSV